MSALRQRIRAFRQAVSQKRPFVGVSSSFWTVPDHLGYGSEKWVKDARNTALAARKEPPDLGLLRAKRPSKNALPLVAAMLSQPGRTLRVLDFGGGAGADGGMLTAIPALEFRYHVVDLAPVVEAGREVWADRREVTFSAELPPPDSRFDLVYAWSAVQYVPEPFALFDRFVDYEPTAILLAFHQIAASTFVTGQVNLGPQPIPQWVFGLDALTSHFATRGYRFALGAWSNKQFTQDAFDLDHRKAGMADLLFLKNGAT
jgi:putative methyltransferase (TIGR04325 family)